MWGGTDNLFNVPNSSGEKHLQRHLFLGQRSVGQEILVGYNWAYGHY